MHLIFDFDGTLVDSFDCVVDQFNQLAEDFHFNKIDVAHKQELRHLNSKDLIALFSIPFYKMPLVVYRARKSLHDNITLLPPFDTIPSIISTLEQQGFSLGIVSSNSEENILTWLRHHKLEEHFSFIHAGSSFFGKKRALKKVIKHHGIESAFYIGDETRDIDAAKDTNLYSMAVTWGFNSEQILTVHKPHCIARIPEDIIALTSSFGCDPRVDLVPSHFTDHI